MLVFVVGTIFALIALAPFIMIAKGSIDLKQSEKIDCPKCGKLFRLVRESSDCPKCKSRVVKTKDGELTFN